MANQGARHSTELQRLVGAKHSRDLGHSRDLRGNKIHSKELGKQTRYEICSPASPKGGIEGAHTSSKRRNRRGIHSKELGKQKRYEEPKEE